MKIMFKIQYDYFSSMFRQMHIIIISSTQLANMAETLQDSPTQGKCTIQNFVFRILDLTLMSFYVMTKILLVPLTYPVYWGYTLLEYFCKIVRLGLTFIMTGIQGVQKALKVGAFAEKIHYAILKQNGTYLKLMNKTLEEIFTCQLYDYGIRKFMSLSNLQEDLKVTEIQFWSPVGINFIKQKFKLKQVSALTNHQQKITRFRNKMKQIDVRCTQYSSEHLANTSNFQDIFIFFNRSREQQQHKIQIDMIKILGYIKKNLNQHGYAVIGNYFNCDGDEGVFEELLDGFGFKIQMKEDITPNITHSRRVLGRIYKNRKLAWGIGKIKQFINLAYQHNNVLSNSIRTIWRILQQISGIRNSDNKYNLYIIEHAV